MSPTRSALVAITATLIAAGCTVTSEETSSSGGDPETTTNGSTSASSSTSSGGPEVQYSNHCVFGEAYSDLDSSPNLTIVEARTVAPDGSMSVALAEQVKTSIGGGHATAQDAIAATDDGAVDVMLLQDAFTSEPYTALRFSSADGAAGTIFYGESLDVAAAISGGALDPCNAKEPLDRWSNVTAAVASLPTDLSQVASLSAMHVTGLEGGQALPHSQRGAMLDTAVELFGDDCAAVPAGDTFGSFDKSTADEFIFFLKQDTDGWQSTLSGPEVRDLGDHFEAAGADNFNVLHGALSGGSCTGIFAMIHNRSTQDVFFSVLSQ